MSFRLKMHNKSICHTPWQTRNFSSVLHFHLLGGASTSQILHQYALCITTLSWTIFNLGTTLFKHDISKRPHDWHVQSKFFLNSSSAPSSSISFHFNLLSFPFNIFNDSVTWNSWFSVPNLAIKLFEL